MRDFKTIHPAVLELVFQLGQPGVSVRERRTPERIRGVVKTPGTKQK